MAEDVFISYSRKDSEAALALAERLRSAGLSVWIDQHGIEAATSWSREIVHAIDQARGFVVLISGNSQQSPNVIRELSIASEGNKKILPVALEDIRLDDEFRYHLAGIQRVAYTQFDAIVAALNGFGIAAQVAQETKPVDTRKTLMVLPFEDLSPTQDNGWFADGLVTELIDKLTKIKALMLIDRQTSLRSRNNTMSTGELASLLRVRYFIEGAVRKFGEQVKVSVGLLDFEDGEYLWQDSYTGVFSDIFAIQESVADNIVAALKLHLNVEEQRLVHAKHTLNADAYEFFLKGREAYALNTRTSFERAITMYQEALAIDPEFTMAYGNFALAHLELYHRYERTQEHLRAAEEAADAIQRIEGETAVWCWITSRLLRFKRQIAEATKLAERAIELDPTLEAAYDSLAELLQVQGKMQAAASVLERQPGLSTNVVHQLGYLIALAQLGDEPRLRAAAENARPVFDRHLRLCPDDTTRAVDYAGVLCWSGDKAASRKQAEKLLALKTLDPSSLFNLSSLFAMLDDYEEGVRVLKRAVDEGYRDLDQIRVWREEFPAVKENEALLSILTSLEEHIARSASAGSAARPPVLADTSETSAAALSAADQAIEHVP